LETAGPQLVSIEIPFFFLRWILSNDLRVVPSHFLLTLAATLMVVSPLFPAGAKVPQNRKVVKAKRRGRGKKKR